MQEKTAETESENAAEIPAEEFGKLVRKFIPGYDGLYSLAEILLAENLPENAGILIVGAGGGTEILRFGRAFPKARLTGVDPSPQMLGAALQTVEKLNWKSRVSLCQGTIEDTKETNFDAATALLVMHFLPDNGEKLAFLRAIHQRLKTGAKFIIADGCYERNSAEFTRLLSIYKKHAQMNEAPPETLEQAIKTIMENPNTVSEKRELELLREAGFGKIESFFQGLWFRGWAATKL